MAKKSHDRPDLDTSPCRARPAATKTSLSPSPMKKAGTACCGLLLVLQPLFILGADEEEAPAAP